MKIIKPSVEILDIKDGGAIKTEAQCRYNPGVYCTVVTDEAKCEKCGWNPQVDDERRDIIRRMENVVSGWYWT